MGFNADASRIALPRGRVFFARKNLTTGVLDAYLHLGDCSKFEFSTIGDDIVEITDFTSSTATPLTRVSKKRAPEFPLSLYECNPDNLALVFMGAVPTDYTQAGGTITTEALAGGVKVGAIYQLANKGIVGGTQIVITSVQKGATAFTAGTHFILRDGNSGLIEILALPAGVSAGDAITCTYTCPAITAGTYKQILGGTAPRIEGALLYVGTSQVGPVHAVNIWNCSLASDGAYPFISADPIEFPLKVTVLSAAGYSDLFRITEMESS